ncbi:MAG: NYN domain-containing protein [Candidatus Pacebacteria bacterium]|nr:NYN domain-containing protein [Candidatus Paceibacterota bacterium]
MENELPNFAFIDSQNLYLSIKNQGWKIDFSKLRIYLKDKFAVEKAYLFMGYMEGNQQIYKKMQEDGYIVIFKPTLMYKDGTTKGNCDAELVLHSMIELPNYGKAIIISGDGDFYCLAEYLRDQKKLKAVIIPDQKRYSALLKKINTPTEKFLIFLDAVRNKVEYTYTKKKAL